MLGIEGEIKLIFYFYFKRPVEIEKKKFCVVSSKQGYSNSMFVQQQYLKWRNGIHVFFCITCFYCFFYTKKTNIKIFNKNLGVEAQQICAETCKKTTFRHFYQIYLSKKWNKRVLHLIFVMPSACDDDKNNTSVRTIKFYLSIKCIQNDKTI